MSLHQTYFTGPGRLWYSRICAEKGR